MAFLRKIDRCRTVIGFALLLSFLILSQFNVAHGANYQTQDGYNGKAICGAADLGTRRLLSGCGYASATKIGKAKGSCPAGTIFDIGNWSCYSCPSGYNRSAFPITSDKACTKEITPQYSAGTFVQNHASCPSGSVLDSRNGGECWKCPSGFSRTMAAVNEWNACGKIWEQARSAELVSRVCPEGTIPDLNGKCYTCPEDAVRTGEAITHHRACMRNEIQEPAKKEAALTCKAGEHFDFIDDGTCWTCPSGSVRTIDGVKSNKACEYTTMRWASKPRTPNGLFNIPGGMEVAADLLGNPDLINRTIRKYMEVQNINDESFFTEAWETIRKEPEQSSALIAATYQHVFNLIKKGAKKDYERTFLDYFAVYVQQSRQLSATEMSNAWESWKLGIALRTGEAATPTSLTNAFNIGYRPPSMEETVGGVLHFSASGAIIASFMGIAALEGQSIALANATASFSTFLRPYHFNKALADGAKQLAQGIARAGANAGAAGGIGVAGVVGPFAVAAVAAVVTSIASDIVADQEKQAAIVNDALQIAKRPVNLQQLTLSEKGRTELMSNWAIMTQEPVKPNASKWASLMQSRVLAGATITGTKWVDLNQKAQGLAIGSDQSVYILTNGVLPEGFQVARYDVSTGKFVNQGILSAIHIAVAGETLWGITKTGKVFYVDKNRPVYIPGPPAREIGASDQYIWILDSKGYPHRFQDGRWIKESGQGTRLDVDRTGRPWVINEKREIWTHDNNRRWIKLKGVATDVAAYEPGKGRVVGTDGRIYTFNPQTQGWEQTGMETNGSRVAINGAQLWRLTKDSTVSQWR